VKLASLVTRRYSTFPLTGVFIGGLFSFRALVGIGASGLAHQPLPAPIPVLLALYPVCGGVGGLLAALTWPLVRWFGGAFIVGVVAVLPMVVGAELIVEHAPIDEALGTGAVIALLIGGFAGAAEWLQENRRPLRLAHLWLFAALANAVAWPVGLHWAGEWPAVLALALFFFPLALAAMATVAKLDPNRPNGPTDDRAA